MSSTNESAGSKQLFKLNHKCSINDLIQHNHEWADATNEKYPQLFPTISHGQSPHTLWIGCSDSRAGDQCLDLNPGEVFVHRNIANLVPFGDLSSLSVVQFAVDVLKVSKIVICGHTDCGGVWAALATRRIGGVMDHWIRNIKDVKARNKSIIDAIEDPALKCKKLVELNVVSQVHNVLRHESVLEAIRRGDLKVYGAVYNVADGQITLVDVPEDENHEDYITEHDGVTLGGH